MCVLRVMKRWSRKVATMLPWLVIALIGLWTLSQLLPLSFLFEIMSPTVSCVFIVLVILFLYDILLPQLSPWRVWRNARIRERKRFEAIELEKMRKTATRICKNCLTPYRDQNPGRGKFMCFSCGHHSRRPLLDMPDSGILKASSDNGGMWRHCFTFALKAFTILFFAVMWLCRKIFSVSSYRERRRMLEKRGKNEGQESRGEKARRKAEEKRQARLEKKHAEEEERTQKEDIAKLVEELRDEKMEAEKEGEKVSPRAKERDSKKEAEVKLLERKKERDKASITSNTDSEELEKRAGKETERNKKSEGDTDRREQHKTAPESMKAHITEVGVALRSKGATASNHNRGNAATRYFYRVKGTFSSSSIAFSRGGFSRKSTKTTNVTREHKPNTLIDQKSTQRKEVVQPDRVSGRSNVNEDDKGVNRHVIIEPQPCTDPTKSWREKLFPFSPAVSSPSKSNVISRQSGKSEAEVPSPPLSCHPTSRQSFDNCIGFGQPSPFTLPSFPFEATTCSARPFEPIFPRTANQDLQIELHFLTDSTLETPSGENIVAAPRNNLQLDFSYMTDSSSLAESEVTQPSPIESPGERDASSFFFLGTPKGG
ncbi:hypothetical protein ACJIZ3_019055 [Penstemon smallii]|uniref:Uncharacterized protein n=1 Tax=Penstemon smallii TaxID=265156 RepID=A0ABD3T1J6_9LAMI